MLDYQTALTQLLGALQTQTTAIESTPLLQAPGRILARDVLAQYDMPMFDNSAMDGFALCLDAQSNTTDFALVGRIAAGDDAAPFNLSLGQAARIFTGALLPFGANAVIAQECTQVSDNTLHCTSAPVLHQHIRRRGEDIRQNDVLLRQGQVLNPASIGLAASQGHTHLPTHAPVRVTVFSSGNELREPCETDLSASAIFDANRYQLLAWLQALGCVTTDGGILPDDLAITQTRLAQAALDCDMVLTSGGVSVGQEDHLKTALEHLGQLQQWKLLIKPGKPFAWGRLGASHVMMLPGNPVSTFVTFKMLVEPALRVLTGASIQAAQPQSLTAIADFSVDKLDARCEFLRGVLHPHADGSIHVEKLRNQGSHMLSACAIADVLIEVPPQTQVKLGDVLRVYPL